MKFSFIFLAIFLAFSCLSAQQHIFQKLYKAPANAQLTDIQETWDEGMILAGLAEVGGTYEPFLVKIDCRGKFEWGRTFGASSTINNVHTACIATRDSHYVLVSNVGSFQSYNCLVVKLDTAGNVVWRKEMQGSRDDVANGAIETSDGGIAVCGWTGSYGQEATTSSTYVDQYVFKLDANGIMLWSFIHGNASAVDRYYDIIETRDSNLVMCGTFLAQGTFYSSLTKIDQNGGILWHHAYGDTNHAHHGYALAEMNDGSLFMTGSTTILGQNFQAWSDELVIKTDEFGDTLWCKVFYGGSSNRFENGADIEVTENEIFVAVATASYPTIGNVPNKHGLLKLDKFGKLANMKVFNRGGSHYTQLRAASDGGYFMYGFTNWSSYGLSNTFTPNIIKMNNTQWVGCFDSDYTSLTGEAQPGFNFVDGIANFYTGGAMTSTFGSSQIVFKDSLICEQNPPGPCGELLAIENDFEAIQIAMLSRKDQSLQLALNKLCTTSPDLHLELFSLNGSMIHEFVIQQSPRIKLNLEGLSKGLYFIRVNSACGIATMKFAW